MRIWIALAALLATFNVIADEVIRLSEPVEVTATHEVFGAPLDDKGPGVSLANLVEGKSELDGQVVRVTTQIAKVCQKKGCFFIAQEGDAVARVSFADYGFFVPTDAGGKDVTLVGTFSVKPLSAKDAAHYAEDLGEEPPAETPEFEYAIVATSVLIPRG